MCTINKVPIRKKPGNLFNDPRVYIYIYIYITDFVIRPFFSFGTWGTWRKTFTVN